MLEEEKDWLARYQKLTYKERKQLGSTWNPVTFKKINTRKLLNSDYVKELKAIIYKKKLWSKALYNDYRKNKDHSLPSFNAIIKHFGGWIVFRQDIFTEEELKELKASSPRVVRAPRAGGYDDAKLFATIQFLDLKTHKDFVKARKAFPDLVPCQKTIYNHFGGYKNLRKMVLTRNLKSIIEKYIILCQNFGLKRLTPYTCRRNGIDIDWAISKTGSKKKFYELVDFAKSTFDFVKSIEDQRKKNKQGNSKNENRGTNKTKS